MAKACPECHGRVRNDAGYCAGCGCQFSRVPAIQVRRLLMVRILAIAIVVALIVGSATPDGKGPKLLQPYSRESARCYSRGVLPQLESTNARSFGTALVSRRTQVA